MKVINLPQLVIADQTASRSDEVPLSERDRPIVKVRDLMTKTLVVVDSDATALQAARIMDKRRVSSVLVSERGKLCGIITDHDIISRVVARGLDSNDIKVARVMSRPLITIADECIDQAAKQMSDEKIRRLVVERNSHVVGVIGESDIIRIEPELHFLIRERSKLKPTVGTEGENIILAGYCEECGNYSPQLRNVNGSWVDEDCCSG